MKSIYKVPAETTQQEIIVKKSRFIARAGFAATKVDVKVFLAQARLDYPDARHYCWAYLFGCPRRASTAAMNDDGEPSGTAGKPILNIIQHKNIGDIILVVIRYFGGIKLGAGGLTRAYSGAAEAVLSQLNLKQLEVMLNIQIKMDFSMEQIVRHWLDVHHGEVSQVVYVDGVEMLVLINETMLNQFKLFCRAHGIQCFS